MKKTTFKKWNLIVATIAAVFTLASCGDDDVDLPITSPSADFTFQVNQTTGVVAFTNTSQNANTFIWDFGDGNTSTLSNPTNTYASGSFEVTLTASNDAGASDTSQQTVSVSVIDDNLPPTDFDSGLLTSGDFEGDNSVWFNEGLNIVTVNGNSFQQVDVRAAGQPFDVNISQLVDLEQGTTYELSFDASSTTEQSILAGIGLNEAPFTNSSQEVNLTTQLERYTVTLRANNFGGVGNRVLFDMGAAIGLVTIDNISLKVSENVVTEPSDFDSGLLTSGDFEGDNSVWFNQGLNIVTENGNSFQQVDVRAAGQPFDVNISQLVDLMDGAVYELSFDASSTTEQSILAGIGLNEAPFTNNSQEVNLTTMLQRYTLTLSSSGFGGVGNRVLFDMGAAIGIVTIDNVSLVQVENPVSDFDGGLLTNGDFESGLSPWISGVDDNSVIPVSSSDGNTFYSVNVDPAGDAFAVNLSQKLEIINGASYTLTFDAWSDRERSILAGVGLSDGDFSANTQSVAINTMRNTYTVTVTANGFGAANARVLFDLGAEVGLVNIDNVSLILNP